MNVFYFIIVPFIIRLNIYVYFEFISYTIREIEGQMMSSSWSVCWCLKSIYSCGISLKCKVDRSHSYNRRISFTPKAIFFKCQGYY